MAGGSAEKRSGAGGGIHRATETQVPAGEVVVEVTKELPVAGRVELSLTGLWRLAIWRVVLGLYLIDLEM